MTARKSAANKRAHAIVKRTDRAPGRWARRGPHRPLYDPKFALVARPELVGADADFESSLVFVVNTLFENGYLHPEDVAPTADWLRASYNSWAPTAQKGDSWADVLFPKPQTMLTSRPGLLRTTLYAPTANTILLYETGTGMLLQQSDAAVPISERGLDDFIQQSEVVSELLIDLLVVVFGALGLSGQIERLRRVVSRILFTPRMRPVLTVLRRILRKLFGRTPLDEVVDDLAELFRLLYTIGVLGEIAEEFLTDLDWWDIALFILGVLSLFAGGVGVAARIAYIIAKLGSTGFELRRKYRNYLAGQPLFGVN